MNRKGFTLIELLAVIIILGILMLIAIPSVTTYINNSRKNTYVDTIKEYIRGASLAVNGGELNVNDPDTTYYLPLSALSTENSKNSPYGKINDAYVVITYDDNKDEYSYYYIGKDDADIGIDIITGYNNIDVDDIKTDIADISTSQGVGYREKIVVFNSDKSVKETKSPDTRIDELSGGIIKYTCKKAKVLHTAKCNNVRLDSYYCRASGYESYSTITFGQIGDSNEMQIGDAYDCDVNADGIYDSETERFYYMTNNGNNGILLYYSNVIGGVPSNQEEGVAYALTEEVKQLYSDITYESNYVGPITAYRELPTISQWKNPNLIHPGVRQIINNAGNTINHNEFHYEMLYNIRSFDYADKAARFLTIQELGSAIGMEIPYPVTEKILKDYPFIFENTSYHEKGLCPQWWLETPTEISHYRISTITAAGLKIEHIGCMATDYGVRPVIELKLSEIEH